ncbi:hypothetical protein BFW01_g1686 [Lasiodiplodia theobromae]|nr:hypothetical protein BFW01_g1686 [Lasiodiplodia theobromae]
MDRPIYEDDLTTIHARHAAPLVQLRHLAATSVRNLRTAVAEEIMQAALMILEDIATMVGDMFPDGEISDPDLPFGQVRMDTEGLHIGHSARSFRENDSVYSEGCSDDDASSSAEESDQEADSLPPLPLTELARTCSATSFANLRHLYTLYYTIHVSRMDRLILRLDTSSTLPNCTVPSRPESICQTPPPSSAAGISYGPRCESPQQKQMQKNCSHGGGAGVPLTEEKEMQYAHVLADEMLQVAEYKEAIVRILVEELAGGMGAA